MKINISLTEKDFLEYQLYGASKSKNIKSQRVRTLIILIVTFCIMLFYAYNSIDSFPYFLLILYIFILVIYKIFESKRYINHYKKYINENYKERFGITFNLNFTENQIIEESNLGESKTNYTALTEINEIENYYFLKLITGQSLIIPKREINDINTFKIKLSEIKNTFGLKENIELNWKWK